MFLIFIIYVNFIQLCDCDEFVNKQQLFWKPFTSNSRTFSAFKVFPEGEDARLFSKHHQLVRALLDQLNGRRKLMSSFSDIPSDYQQEIGDIVGYTTVEEKIAGTIGTINQQVFSTLENEMNKSLDEVQPGQKACEEMLGLGDCDNCETVQNADNLAIRYPNTSSNYTSWPLEHNSWNNCLHKVFNSSLGREDVEHVTLPYSVEMSVGQWFRVSAYIAIFILGVIGNTLVVVTLLNHRNMRTITNLFLLNLAVSDLLLGVFCMPFTLVGSVLRDFIFGPAMCKLIPYMQAVSVSVSVWTLVAISLERFYAICKPLTSRQWQTMAHASKVVAGVWIVSLVLMLPIAILSELIAFGHQTGQIRQKCREVWPSELSEKIFNVLLSSFLLLLPLIIMAVAYMKIVKCLSKGMSIEKQQVMANSQCSNSDGTRRGIVAQLSVRFKKFPKNNVYGSDYLEPNDGSVALKEPMSRSKSCDPFPSESQERLKTVQEDRATTGGLCRFSSLKRVKNKFVKNHTRGYSETAFMDENSYNQSDGNTSDSDGRLFERQGSEKMGMLSKRKKVRESYHSFRPIRSTHLRQSLVAKQKVVRMLFVLVAEFFVCWTPLYIMNNLALWIPNYVYALLGNVGVSLIQLVAYASSCCNPITYCFMNATFLDSFKQVFSIKERRPSGIGRGFESRDPCQSSFRSHNRQTLTL